MGMMDSQMPQQVPQQGGMTGGEYDPGYNGNVLLPDGTNVVVSNGYAKVNNQSFFVTADGSVVVNDKHELVGQVLNGKFQEPDEAQMKILQSKGAIVGVK